MNNNKMFLNHNQLKVPSHLILWDKKEFLKVLLKMKANKNKIN